MVQEQGGQGAVSEDMTLEEAFSRLDQVVERLESREITLEELESETEGEEKHADI